MTRARARRTTTVTKRAARHADRTTEWIGPDWRRRARDQRRPRRAAKTRVQRDGVKPVSIRAGELTRAERFDWAVDEWELQQFKRYPKRPRTLGECVTGPCPWVSCKYNVFLDYTPNPDPTKPGFITMNFPGRQVWELEHTCAMQIAVKAEQLGETLTTEEIAEVMNLTSERLRQLTRESLSGLAKIIDPRNLVRRIRGAGSEP